MPPTGRYFTPFGRYWTAGIFLAVIGFFPLVNLEAWAQQSAPGSNEPLRAAPSQATSPGTAGSQTPLGPDEVVLTVGNQKITAAEFEKMTKALPPDAAGALAAMGKRGFAERFANLLSLAMEGEKRKVDQGDTFQEMAKFQRMMLLAQLTLTQIVSNMGEMSPDEVNNYYKAHLTDFQQIKLRGIYIPFDDQPGPAKEGNLSPAGSQPPASKGEKPKLTETEAKAKAEALRSRIVAGEKMAELAKKESDHATASSGGDFGFVRKSQFSPQIDNVIFALELNQVSVPVRDRFGYFIFQAEEKRTQPLEETKPIIENGLRQQKVGEFLQKLQDQYKVDYNPRYFGEAAPTPGVLGTPTAPKK
jgi:PPIC-type peptidyl-prolyl cis-trans isomerase-like protein